MTAELLDLSAYVRAGDAKELIGGSWKSLRSLVRCGEVAALPTPLGRLYRRADLERLRTLRQREEP